VSAIIILFLVASALGLWLTEDILPVVGLRRLQPLGRAAYITCGLCLMWLGLGLLAVT
jgi:hypothetical protein